MNIQEMFDKAYIGLASQDFEPSHNGKRCVYSDKKGNRCAWGWVDLSLDESQTGNVMSLHREKIGIAATLDGEQLCFAQRLQDTHDNCFDKYNLKIALERLAKQCNLTIPNVD